MPRTYSTATNKKQNNPKVDFEQYLYHESEPTDNMYGFSLDDRETEFQENGYGVRHRLRHFTQRLRNRYS